MKDVLKLIYASSLSNFQNLNSSFDKAELQIAYHGDNRNQSSISKEVFEACAQTAYNCPVVCNYIRETDSLGGHDVEVVRAGNEHKFVNITTPVGVVPESANIFWKTVTEEDGSENEYLCADVLIWKRQEAYSKLKEDGCVSESMEITVKDGEMIDGIYHIYDFEFTAFALIGVEPCYESAALSFAKKDFKEKLSQMMSELKETYSLSEVVNNKSNKEGGSVGLDKKFMLECIVRDGLRNAIESEKITEENGYAHPKYYFIDYDRDENLAYFEDWASGICYEAPFTISEDGSVTVDFESIKEGKLVPIWKSADELDEPETVDEPEVVDEEETPEEFSEDESVPEEDTEELAAEADDVATDGEEIEALKARIEELETKLAELTEYKKINEQSCVLDEFADLSNVDEFKQFKEDFASGKVKFDTDKDLREACFAIRGRNCDLKFNFSERTPRIKVSSSVKDEAPYGGLIERYAGR